MLFQADTILMESSSYTYSGQCRHPNFRAILVNTSRMNSPQPASETTIHSEYSPALAQSRSSIPPPSILRMTFSLPHPSINAQRIIAQHHGKTNVTSPPNSTWHCVTPRQALAVKCSSHELKPQRISSNTLKSTGRQRR